MHVEKPFDGRPHRRVMCVLIRLDLSTDQDVPGADEVSTLKVFDEQRRRAEGTDTKLMYHHFWC